MIGVDCTLTPQHTHGQEPATLHIPYMFLHYSGKHQNPAIAAGQQGAGAGPPAAGAPGGGCPAGPDPRHLLEAG